MKILRALWMLLFVSILSTVQAQQQTATARMHCWSLRFNRATAAGAGGGSWQLGLTTISSSRNGELALDPFGTGYTHSSDIELYDQLTELEYGGFLALDVPGGGDANGNGLPDFFEVSQPVNSLVTTGILEYGGNGYEVQATWSRTAGSGYGTCHLPVPDPFNPFGDLNFFFSFQLIEYNGVLTYTPGVTNVLCMLSVTNTDLFDGFDGPIEFVKSASDPVNELTLVGANLTNTYAQPLGFFIETLFVREAAYPSNYIGAVEFDDGDPASTPFDADYFTWQLSINDLNDTDEDGIPDFSDDPTVSQPAVPNLAIELGASDILLTITGEMGRMHEILSAGSVASTSWQTNLSVTLTNSPQVILLPRPEVTTFWQVVAY